MKRLYKFSDGESLWSDKQGLQKLLTEYEGYVRNYSELLGCLDDAEFVARGHGFCDAKYSDDFVEGQLERFSQRVKDIKCWLASLSEE